MKTSEDNLNEALRAVLKRKFDDYEELPNPSAFGKIRARLTPVRRWRYLWLSWSALVIGIIAIGTKEYLNAVQEGNSVTQTGQKAVSGKTGQHSAPAALSVRPASANPVQSETELSKGEAIATTAHQNDRKLRTDGKKLRIGNEKSPHEGRYVAPNAAVKEKPLAADSPQQGQEIAANSDERQPAADGSRGEPSVISPSVTDPQVAGRGLALEPLDPITSDGLDVHMARRTVSPPPRLELKREIAVNPSKLTWLANAAVLHTYQILTVPSSAAKDFQNFSFPSVFAFKSMGYKLSAGVEKKGLQLQLHYSGFRQSYSYEVANDSYLVKPGENGNYETVRQGDRINEDAKYSLLGIGISKTMRWGRSPYSRFYATAGLEYSHSLTDSRSLGWLNLGIGKQIAVNRKSALHIGPYAEFSPMKISGTGNPFFYQPYRVGISMGLRFVRP